MIIPVQHKNAAKDNPRLVQDVETNESGYWVEDCGEDYDTYRNLN